MLTALRSCWHDGLHGLRFVPGAVASGFVLLQVAEPAVVAGGRSA